MGDEVDEIAQNVQSGDRLFCCCGGVLLDVPFFMQLKNPNVPNGFVWVFTQQFVKSKKRLFFMKKFIL